MKLPKQLTPKQLISRRNLLLTGSAIATTAAAGGLWEFLQKLKLDAVATTNLSSIIRGGLYIRPDGPASYTKILSKNIQNKAVYSFDLPTNKVQIIASVVPPHVVETHPIDKSLSAVTSRRGDLISMVDWNSEREISTFQFNEDRVCSAHSAFAKDGKILLVPCIDSRNSASGSIAVFEVPNLKLIDEIQLSRGLVHDILPLDGDDEFVFGSLSGRDQGAGFGVLNFATKKIQYYDSEFNGNSGLLFFASHLKRIGNVFLAGVNMTTLPGQYGPGAVISFDPKQKKVETVIGLNREGLKSELLSLEFDPMANFVWITLPTQNRLIIWDLKSKSLFKTIEFSESPTFVSVLSEQKLVIVGSSQRLYAFDSQTGEPRKEIESRWPSGFIANRFCAHSRLV